MKVKELIEELQKFNPDGIATVTTISTGISFSGNAYENSDQEIVGIEDSACAMMNPVIVARE